MADVVQYKCPSCGGTMDFNSSLQLMHCPFCDSRMSVSEYEEWLHQQMQAEGSADQQSTAQNSMHADSSEGSANENQEWKSGETDGLVVSICQSCGGEIIAEESTMATSCPFCDNRVLVTSQFSGGLRPNYVIPFKLDKAAAKEQYRKHLHGKAFLPHLFKDENHIDEIKGIYVPFWLFDMSVDADMQYEGINTRSWISGDTRITEKKHYHIYREGSMRFTHLPTDASKKMDDDLMDSLEPYSFDDAVNFEPAYLSGYLANRYDVSVEDCVQRAGIRAKKCTEDSLRNTVREFQQVIPRGGDVRISKSDYKYALYPVWLLNTTWKGERFIFAMNGQTGKFIGNLPADYKAFWKFVVLWGLISSILIYIAIFIAFML